MTSAVPYPVRVDASLQPRLSRWLWLVKWLLAIPHFVVLGLLWIAFAVLSLVAFVSILITGRYPRAIFDFNVGVLRWGWRVAYYSYAAFGTDRYPPFTLAEVPDYPAHLEIAYPERLSRGLVLVKWWLLAIPHYIITGLFVGGGTWLGWQFTEHSSRLSWTGGGLIGILALIAAVVLAVTGRYPQQIFDFVLGMDRWVLRVAAYVGLMTDRYPPFRLDMGGHEPGGTLTLAPPEPVTGPVEPAGGPGTPETGTPAHRPGTGWTAGRVVAVVAGAVLAVGSLGLVGAGGVGLWADASQRQDGYLSTGVAMYHTDGYAIASEPSRVAGGGHRLIGDVRIRIRGEDSATPVFIGIAPADAADRYLSGVRYTTVTNPGRVVGTYRQHTGTAPATPPAAAGIWVAQASGTGNQTLVWPAQDGRWVVVAMNQDGSPGLTVHTDLGATVPALRWFAIGAVLAGALLLLAAAALIVAPVRGASR